MQQAFARLVTRVMHGKAPPGIRSEPELPDIICELGYRYTSGAFCKDESTDFDKNYEDPYEPYVLPGGRLPHVALISAGKGLSSLDLIKQNFVIFTVQEDSPWLEASSKQKIPPDCHVIGSTGTYQDHRGAAQVMWKLEEGEALLVRPDGIIAWRSGGQPSEHANALKKALDSILH
jgi:hypothetical protein